MHPLWQEATTVADNAQTSGGIAGRIVRAAGAQGINQLARILQLFLLVPICLTAWGTGAYEDWLLVNSVTAFLLLSDLGFVQFTTVKLIDAWSKGEQQRFSREWARALGLFAPLTAALTCGLAAIWVSPGWTALMPTRLLHPAALASITALLASTQVAMMLVSLGLGAYRARGDLSRSYHVSSILVLLQTGGIAMPAVLGGGPVESAAGTCMVTVAGLAAVIVDLRLRYRDVTWKPIWPSFAELSGGLTAAIGYLVSPVATTIMLNGPNLILAQTGAPQGAIALFTASRTIAGVARQLPYQFAHPAGVELAAMLARGDRENLSRLYARAGRALAIIVGMLSGATVVAAPLVMALWTRGQIIEDPILMLFLVGTTTICAPAQVAYTLFWYGGYPGPLNKALVISTALAMSLATALAFSFETRGVAAGLGVGEIVGTAVYLSLLSDRLLERKTGTGLLQNFWITLLSFSSSAAIGYLLYRLIEPRGWFGLMAFGCAWAVPAAAGAYWTLLTGQQQARVLAVAASLFRLGRSRSAIKNAKPADLR